MADEDTDQERSGDDTILGLDKRKALITLALALVLVVAATALIGQVANYGQLEHAARRADKRWLAVCLVGEILAYLGYILAYRDVARAGGGPELPYRRVTRVVAVGFGAYVVGSAAGGLAVDYWALHRAGAGPHESARRVLALNTLQWLCLGIFAALSAVAVLFGRGSGAPLAMTLSWLIVVPACIVAALWVSSPKRAQRFAELDSDEDAPLERRQPSTWLPWLGAKLRRGFADAVGGVVLVRHVIAHPLRFWAGILGYPIYWAGDILCVWAALQAFGVSLDPTPLILGYTTAYVISALPLPAGGAGGIEAALSTTLHLVGAPLAPALLGAVLYRVFTFWLPILPALLFVTRLHGLSEALPETPRQKAAGDGQPALYFRD
jgi:putative heme transporter